MKKILCLILSVLTGFLIIGGMTSRWTLDVKARKSGEIFFRERVQPGERFQFRYTHSVEKTPIEILFEVEKNGFLRMVEMRFASHGPGLPTVAERGGPGGEWFVTKGGGSQEKVSFLFIPLNQPFLKIKGREIRLLAGSRDGGALEFTVSRDSWLGHLWRTLNRSIGTG